MYAPHQPLEILNYQNILNMTAKNNTEFKIILKDINIKKDDCQPTGLELIMATYKSTFKQRKFKEKGFIMDKSQLFFTMDFNFMNVLSHALENKSILSTEMIFDHMDEASFSMNNYFVIMMSFKEILDANYGQYLAKYL